MDALIHGSVKFGIFELDAKAGELRKRGKRLHLRPQPFRILTLLISRAGQLVVREELQQQLWGKDTFVDLEQGLNVCIRQIRAVLNDHPDKPQFLETVPRRGYRFIASSIKAEPAATQPAAAASAIDSLAIFPFENSSGESGLEYLCDGIVESVINNLSLLRQLRVVSRGTAFRYKDVEDLLSVGRELHVGAVVTGKITLRGETIRVQAELVDLATHSQLWGGHYSRKLSDIFDLQEELAKEICDNLHLRLSPEEKKHFTKRYTQQPEAYQIYLKGRYCADRRTEAELQQAIEHFHQAIVQDPRYALAYSGLADAYTLLGCGSYGALSSKKAMEDAKAMAVRALALDDTLAEAHTSLAFVRFRFDRAWSDAEKEFRRALELNPHYATAHHWYALFLAAMGRFDLALEEITSAQTLDPRALPIHTAKARILHFARRYDEAMEQFQNVLKPDPNFVPAHFDLGSCYEQKAMLQEALTQFQTCVALSGGRLIYVAAVAEAYARLGREDEARNILDQLQEASGKQYVSPNDMALIHASLGEKDEAFTWLEKAYQQRDASLVWLKVAPEFDSLRSDSRFEDLLRQMNFPA